ncbi:MAG: hypothetical protein KME32_33155 [Mojavia pulchra JT2-VF2]|jgi:hypothetical protein|uniref:Uncharacterized protein n=1 Tax=Mojavia pulchra JT2-VF2 TaxID=287848 RepID=A0A951UJG4_9NOST|nr:hypothetical protein [Mojavia pulchra JT2-VF2]
MRRYIEKLTSDKYGYTYDEVSEMLKGLGINLTGSRIKYLVGELKKSSRRRQKTSENGSSTSVQEATENQSAVVESSEAEEALVKDTTDKRKK